MSKKRVKKSDSKTLRQRRLKSGRVELEIAPSKLARFVECVRRTGKIELRIAKVGSTVIPPEIMSVVDAKN